MQSEVRVLRRSVEQLERDLTEKSKRIKELADKLGNYVDELRKAGL